jgi:hypothetical protein
LSPKEEKPLFVSYPKSGRTWIRYFLSLRGIELNFSHAGTGSGDKSLGRRVERFDTSRARKHRIIFMHRNPIDTAISLYFQVHRKDFRLGSRRYIRSWPAFALQHRLPPRDLERFLDHPGYGVEKVSRFNATWLSTLESRSDCLVFSYEAARRHEEETFAQLLDFLGEDDTALAETVEESSFHKMQQREREGDERSLRLRVAIPGDPDSAKVRRGKIGGYVDYLEPPLIDRYRAVAAAYGLEA